MSVWKQKAEATRVYLEAVEAHRAAVAAEASKTPEQKAAEAEKARMDHHCHMMCDSTAEHGLSPGQRRQQDMQEERWRKWEIQWAEQKRIREGGHPKVDLKTDFPALKKN